MSALASQRFLAISSSFAMELRVPCLQLSKYIPTLIPQSKINKNYIISPPEYWGWLSWGSRAQNRLVLAPISADNMNMLLNFPAALVMNSGRRSAHKVFRMHYFEVLLCLELTCNISSKISTNSSWMQWESLNIASWKWSKSK